MTIEQSIAEECVDFALFFGVNPHYLIAVAKKRSNLTDVNKGTLHGPFQLSQAEWDAHRADPEFEFNFSSAQITSWRRTCDVFALMTYRTQNALLQSLGRYPSAVELYEKQWPAEAAPTLATDLKTALDATKPLLAPAIATLDVPAESGGAVTRADQPITPVAAPATPTASSFGTGPFNVKAPRVMRALIDDFRLTPIQAAGILGNIGQECGGFRFYHELGQTPDKGGVGWVQWTGPRRKQYEAYCAQIGLDPPSDEANYSFLKYDLSHSPESKVMASLRRATTIDEATTTFEEVYERAKAAAMPARIRYANIALKAYEAQQLSS